MAENKENVPEKLDEALSEEIEKTDGMVEPETVAQAKPAPLKLSFKQKLKRFLHTKKGKAVCVLIVLIIALGLLCAIPTTRYGIFGTFMKKNVQVLVMDASTMKPVSQAVVRIADKEAKTDNKGKATLEALPVGEYSVKVTKKYYRDSEISYTIPVLSNPKDIDMHLTATGRQVTVSVVNSITRVALAKATITVQDTSAITDDKGIATIVLPADKKALTATIKRDGYNDISAEIKVTDQLDANKLSLTPSGTVFYLSKQTGKINVMKSNLDGTGAQTVVEGTGNENDNTTVLLAARDWKYMALSANRTGAQTSQLYVINAATGGLDVIDQGDVGFQLIGWSNHRFIYLVSRNNKPDWSDKHQALKSYDAETGKITTLDETDGGGTNSYDYQREAIGNPYILEGKVVYAKTWQRGSNYMYVPTDKKSAIMAVNPDGSGKQRSKEFAMQHYISIDGKIYEPQGIYFRVAIDGEAAKYYEYEAGAVKEVSNTDDKFYNTFYPTYLVSPTGQKTFWYEPRDGKNVLFVGNSDGADKKELVKQSDYTAYGWYTDEYVLLSKNDSELFIAATNDASSPLKITNYHKPAIRYPGYGYGYGGN